MKAEAETGKDGYRRKERQIEGEIGGKVLAAEMELAPHALPLTSGGFVKIISLWKEKMWWLYCKDPLFLSHLWAARNIHPSFSPESDSTVFALSICLFHSTQVFCHPSIILSWSWHVSFHQPPSPPLLISFLFLSSHSNNIFCCASKTHLDCGHLGECWLH